jgi:muramoyltetrapeptide carboxypeptidase
MIKKPQVLKKGDRVGIVAPGAHFNQEAFDKSIETLKSWDLVPVLGQHLFEKHHMFAGTVEQRVKSFMKMVTRKDIQALWCVRGGSGGYEVAQKIAGLPVPKTPKIFVGISDTTGLHLVLGQKWKWPTLHGPLFDRLGTEKMAGEERFVLKSTLFDSEYRLRLTEGLAATGPRKTIIAPITGGNLTLVAASLGGKWEIMPKGKILFLEEIGEQAYRIDRLLYQLEAAGKFKGVKGVIIGDFTGCKDGDGEERWPEIVKQRFERLKIPVLWGVQSGHGEIRLTIPFEVKVRLQTKGQPSLEVIEGFCRA